MFHYAPLPLQTDFNGEYHFQDVWLCICRHDSVWTYIYIEAISMDGFLLLLFSPIY